MKPNSALIYSSGKTSQSIRTGILTTEINDAPSIQMHEPSSMETEPENYQVTISWEDDDPDDDATIALYYDEGEDFNGTLIVDGIKEDHTADTYVWNVRDVLSGKYWIYGVISDLTEERDPSEFSTTRSYAGGKVIIENATPTISILSPNASTAGDDYPYSDSFLIEWEAEDPENDALISLYYDSDDVGGDGQKIIDGLSEDNSENYIWRLNRVFSGKYYVYAMIDDTVNLPAGPVYSSTRVNVVQVTSQQNGFPVQTGSAVLSSPVLADLDGDATAEVIVGSDDAKLYVMDGNGQALAGFPVTLDSKIQVSPAVGNVVGDGSPEVVVASYNGSVYVLDADGQFLSRTGSASAQATAYATIQGPVVAAPSLYDFDEDGKLDIVIADGAGNLNILFSNGANTAIPVAAIPLTSSPAVADLDGNGSAEIIVGSGKSVYAYSSLGALVSGFPLTIASTVSGSPAVADLDGNDSMEIVFGTLGRKLYAISSSGQVLAGFPVDVDSAIKASPIVTHFADPDQRFIVAADTTGMVYVVSPAGVISASTQIDGSVYGDPATADIDANGQQEIVISTNAGNLYALREDLSDALGSPTVQAFADVGSAVYTSLAVADIDGDEDAEVVFGDFNGAIQAWDLVGAGFDGDDSVWPMFRKDAVHSGWLQTPAVPLAGDLNGDGLFDSNDLFLLAESWHARDTGSLAATQDLNQNQMLDGMELIMFIQRWHEITR